MGEHCQPWINEHLMATKSKGSILTADLANTPAWFSYWLKSSTGGAWIATASFSELFDVSCAWCARFFSLHLQPDKHCCTSSNSMDLLAATTLRQAWIKRPSFMLLDLDIVTPSQAKKPTRVSSFSLSFDIDICFVCRYAMTTTNHMWCRVSNSGYNFGWLSKTKYNEI